MTDMNQDFAMPDEIKPPVPSGINVLTILTFIGCGLGFLGQVYSLAGGAKRNVTRMEATVNSSNFDQMPGFIKKMNSPEMIEQARKMADNIIPLSLVNILAIALCLIGAIQMRKLRAQGYYLYIIGEVLPLIALLVFVGVQSISGFTGIIAVVITALFIILYSAQRKYLINK